MIFSEIRSYFLEHRVVSLQELSNHFGIEPDAMRGMLGQWERKMKVRKAEKTSCGSNCCCNSCDSGHTEFYEWLD